MKLDIIYTDNPQSTFIEEMRAEGVEVVVLTPEHTGSLLAETLRNRNVELLVTDDFHGEIPSEVREAYGEAIVNPTSAQSAPLDVITTVDRLNAALRNKLEEPRPSEESIKEENKREETAASDVEKEWADALEVDIEEEKIRNPQPPEYREPQQQPPAYNERPTQRNPEPPRYGYNGQQNSGSPGEPMPDTYLVWSVVITLLCCLIFGVIAIVYSASVSSKYYRGDIEGARRASRNAQIWCIVSIVAGIVWATLYVPLSLLIP